MKKLPLLLLVLLTGGVCFAQRLPINCATNTPCTQNGPINTKTGDPLWQVGYKINSNFNQIFGAFGATGLLRGNGPLPNPLTPATYADVAALFTGCSSTTPALGYQGTCVSGGGSMVYPGAGIPLSTGTAWGTSYATTGTGDVVLSTSPTLQSPALGTPSAIVLTNGTGLPYSALTSGTITAAAMTVGSGASLTTSGSGSISANEVNGGAVPTSAQCLSSNSSSQIVSGCPEPIGNGGAQITSLPYTVATTDCGSQLVINDASAGALDVPQATGIFATCQFDVTNIGAGTATITPTTSTVNGATTLPVPTNTQCTLNSDGTNWQVIGCTALTPPGVQLNVANTWSAAQTFPSRDILIGGSSTGTTTLAATNAAGTNYVQTFMNYSGDVADINVSGQAWNGSQLLDSGNWYFNNSSIVIDSGTTFTLSGGTGACATTTALTGGNSTGSFECTGTSGASSVIVALPTADKGWVCEANDLTTTSDTVHQTASTTTSCTLSGTISANDVINFHGNAY